MKWFNARYVEAVLILSGMIIGVGMFGIPISFVKAGFWLGALELLLITAILMWLHILYGEVVIKTPSSHRLPGYVRLYLGGGAARLSWASAFFGIVGTLLAYIVVGSIFLHVIFQNVWGTSSEFIWAVVVTALGAAVTLFPLKREALINGILTTLLIVFIAGLTFYLFPNIKTANFTGFNVENFFIPYGVFLFALAGGVVVPDVVAVLGKDKKRTRSAIVVGTLIPAVLYFLFAFSVVGSLGVSVSDEAIQGLLPVAGYSVVFFGSIVGFLAVITSFIVLSMSFQALLKLDFKMHKISAWMVASGLPFLLYLFGIQNFIVVIGAVGAVAVGIDSAFVIALQHRLHRSGGGSFHWLSYAGRAAIFVMIIVGVIFETYKLIG
jgi:tyrosine-specific transport protein